MPASFPAASPSPCRPSASATRRLRKRRSSWHRKPCSPASSRAIFLGERLPAIGLVGCALIFAAIIAVEALPVVFAAEGGG